jgi:hypothetical protein
LRGSSLPMPRLRPRIGTQPSDGQDVP